MKKGRMKKGKKSIAIKWLLETLLYSYRRASLAQPCSKKLPGTSN